MARFRGLGGFACGRVFVVGRNMGGCVCVSEAFAARVLRCSLRRGFIDEDVERDRSLRVLSCCMTSSPLSIKTKDHSSLLGKNLWGDRKGEEFIVSIGAGCKIESISCRFSS